MPKMVFINLPVEDLVKATEFYEAVGFTINPVFSDDKASCMVWSESIFVMLLKHDFYKKFILSKNIVDAHTASEVLLSLAMQNKAEVDDFVKKALNSGGKLNPPPEMEGNGSMYYRDIEDLDGHIWEVFYMEMPQ